MLNKNVQAKEESECLVEEEENVCRIWFERILVLFSLESSVLRDLDVTIFCYEIIFCFQKFAKPITKPFLLKRRESSSSTTMKKLQSSKGPRSNKHLKPNIFSA